MRLFRSLRHFRILVFFLLFSASCWPALGQTLTRVTDDLTGIEVALPLDMLPVRKRTKWGTNWQSSGNHLNIDTLNFGSERSLSEVYSTLKGVRGRRVTNNVFDPSYFVIEGTDSDGTWFYVTASTRGGAVRGLSIVYSNRSSESLARSIAGTFSPFPETQVAQRNIPAPIEPRSQDGASQRVSELTRELERVKEQLKEQERERERQKDIERIRKQERERVEQEFALREQERRARADEDRAKEQREAQRFADERRQARDREAELEKKIAEIQKEFKLRQSAAPSATSQTSGKRVAFVAGIDKYANLPANQQLKTAANDARLVAATLDKLGFQVVETSVNVSRSKFNRDWQRFLNSIERGSVAAFFFAGHGVQLDGQNYLLPGDIPPADVGQREFLVNEAISFNILLSQLAKQAPKLSLIILDACRDDPFAEGTRGGHTRGLANIKDEVKGTFIMYSAAAGEAALDRLPNEDGDNHNSIYTRSLVPLLLEEGITINQVALRVRREAGRLSNNQQNPAYYDGLRDGTLCLSGSCSDEKSAAR
jgi:hypothetical protein